MFYYFAIGRNEVYYKRLYIKQKKIVTGKVKKDATVEEMK